MPVPISSDSLRRIAIQELTTKLPAYKGNEWFENEVCQGRLQNRGYNSGPDLCHWLLWKLGCRDSTILCRSLPERGISWNTNGIQHMVWGAQRKAAWRPFLLEHVPNPGDILYLGNTNKGEPDRLCVFLWASVSGWVTADATEFDAFDDPCALIVCRPFAGYHLSFTGQSKQINGWVDITQLDLEVTDEPA